MPNQNDPILLNNPRPASLPALEIITSKYLAICVRFLTIPIGTAATILAGLALSSHTKQPYRPFLIAVAFSLLLNLIDAIMLGFEIWGPALEPPTTRTSSQQYVLPRSYRASPGWRGTFDLAIAVVLLIVTGGLTRCDDYRSSCKWDEGKVPASQYLGVVITIGHVWLCVMAVLESFYEHRRGETEARNAG